MLFAEVETERRGHSLFFITDQLSSVHCPSDLVKSSGIASCMDGLRLERIFVDHTTWKLLHVWCGCRRRVLLTFGRRCCSSRFSRRLFSVVHISESQLRGLFLGELAHWSGCMNCIA